VGDERIESIARELGQNSQRLSNIEAAVTATQLVLQDMAKAMISVARVEERLAASHSEQERMAGQIDELRRELRELTKENSVQSADNAATDVRGQWLERAFWIAVTTGVAYYVSGAPTPA
jgi:septal ring factor EnvC (AmiA/AmiB activator)